MHETALMYDVLRTLEASAKENNIEEITELKLVIGSLSSILPDALRFAFDAFKGSPPLAQDAVLKIEERKPQALCNSCGSCFTIENPWEFSCARCGGVDIRIQSGEELYIEYYKGRERSVDYKEN
ncbi:MAG: hydrogenase maturation nickel metallochaperone HypA [Clostridia bacterium]|nr:hydrogenase maturation nickel metallochaperone HypA [Clostridia bacterium]